MTSTLERLPTDVAVVRGAISATPVFRAAGKDDDSLGTLVIRFSRFNVWYEVDSLWEGRFLERTRSGSFVQTIHDDRALMRVLFDHGFDPTIGNKVLGPIADLREEADSPAGEVPLLDTAYNRELLPGLKVGVYGSSFRMRVLEDSWVDEPEPSDHNPKGLPERTILRVKTMEFGPVTFPANPESTADMRSLTDSFYDRLKQRDTSAYEAAVRAAGRLPDLTGRPERGASGGGDLGTQPGNGAVPVISPRQRADTDALRLRGIKL